MNLLYGGFLPTTTPINRLGSTAVSRALWHVSMDVAMDVGVGHEHGHEQGQGRGHEHGARREARPNPGTGQLGRFVFLFTSMQAHSFSPKGEFTGSSIEAKCKPVKKYK